MTTGRDTTLPEQDADARDAALDVARSFVVQAPAGSGKTELLIQRMLALLAVVARPERVLAITFTRKAAGEMRERIVGALVSARDAGDGDDGSLEPHERTTRRLARAVLARDAAQGWNLIAHTSRLAVQTIDALAQAIALQAPLAGGLPPAPRFTDDAKPLYRAAARAAIVDAAADHAGWRRLLDHQDNDADALADRLADLLSRRDQWRTLAVAGEGEIRGILERSLGEEVAGELSLVAPSIARADFSEFGAIARAALDHLGPEHGELRIVLEGCAARGGAPPLDADHLEDWRELVGWLMTASGKDLRKSPKQMPGVPAIGSGPGKEERRTLYDAVQRCLASLHANPDLRDALLTLVALPPLAYRDEEWARIEALLSLLPGLAARLEVEFANAREYDFSKATFAALAALGEGDAPTELLLRLDLRIDHLLVDEFQDTSYAHLDLVGALVSGWTAGDGRTLFAVGDPMQSIYRFRGAEVRAFVDAMDRGTIEGVAVEKLVLRRNFRSRAGLVDWVNRHFPAVLGTVNEPWQGRVAFAEAIAAKPAEDAPAVTLDNAADEVAQAEVVVARAREAQARGDSVAILVRSRSHLGALLPALRNANLAYSAVDLDALADRPAVRDLVSLTHAIVQPDDRLAWLALLRGPACGLDLADLHAIVRAADGPPMRSIDEVLAANGPALPGDASMRIARCAQALEAARRTRGRAPLAERVRAAWVATGGPATLREPLDLVAADDVLALIVAHERAGDIPDWAAFTARLAEVRLSPPPGDGTRIQVMTMHRAKGLEFDTVILPGLAEGKSGRDASFLRWRKRRHGLLIGLARSRGGEHDGVYAYLKSLGAGEDEAELSRLAYVACTRAKRRLALVAVLQPDRDGRKWKRPGGAAILGRFDDSLLEEWPAPLPHDDDAGSREPETPAPLERLPAAWRPAPAPEPLRVPSGARRVEPALPFDWARERARRLGVVVHHVFARIAAEGLARWDDASFATRQRWIESALLGEGALPDELAVEVADVRATVTAALADARGRWLFDAAHLDARSEWALTGVDEGDIVHVVLDRSFVADGVRWIVDFKTGSHEGSDPARFLDAEIERYRAQLERYGRIVAALDPAHPVQLALYHPRVPGGWRAWPARSS